MKIFTKLKLIFKKPVTAEKPFGQMLQDYLKIKNALLVSDVKVNGGINFKINYKGSIVPFWLVTSPGITAENAQPEIQKALEMIVVGLINNLNLVEISQALKEEKIV